MRRFIKLSSEAQDAAKWCARRNIRGVPGDPLPEGLSNRAWKEINTFPREFRLAVHMSKTV